MTQDETPDPADEAPRDQSPPQRAHDEAPADTTPIDRAHATTQPVGSHGITEDVKPPAPPGTAPSGGDDPARSDGTSEAPAGGAPPPPPPAGPPPPRSGSPQDPPPHSPPPPQAPPPGWGGWSRPPLRSLSRRSDDRVLCGVASGLGDYFNVDPAIFRLVFVGLTFFGGTGFMLYGLGWVLLPDRATGHSIGEDVVRRFGGPRSVVTWIVAAIGLLMLVNATSFFDADLLWAAVLIGVGVLFFRREDATTTGEVDRGGDLPPAPTATPQASPYTAPSREPSYLGTDRGIETMRPSTMDDGWRPTPYVPSPSPPPPPSVLGRITVAATLIVCGVLALLQTLTAFDVSVDTYAALATIVVGAGLVVGARFGRSRGLIALGVVLVATMAVTASVRSYALFNGMGDRTWQPTTVAELPDRYELGMGQMTIDLSELELEPGSNVTVEGAIGIGELEVDVPPDATVDVTATSNGSVSAFDRQSDGTGAEVAYIRDGPEGSPTITLQLSAGMGEVDVQDAVTADRSPLAPPGVN